jgi:hypothetical protein
MPPTVIATPGATDATSYVTVAEADAKTPRRRRKSRTSITPV